MFINTQAEKNKYQYIEFFDADEIKQGQIKRALSFYKKIKQLDFRKELNSLIKYGLRKYEDYYINHDDDNFVLYQKYSRKDVCRLLNWERDESATLYGYRIKYGTCPIFVTYKKKEDISDSTKYKDEFINETIFSWMTRSTGAWRKEAETIMNYKENNLKIFLFIKKSDGEGSDFYYMGRTYPIECNETINTNGAPIMNITLKLEHAVRSDIYDYFIK